MNGLQEVLLNLAVILITGAVTAISAQATTYFKQKGLLNVFDKKRDSVEIAVKAVEQIAINEEVPNKYNEAKRRTRELLSKQKIWISEKELDSLIEAAVTGLRQGYQDNK